MFTYNNIKLRYTGMHYATVYIILFNRAAFKLFFLSFRLSRNNIQIDLRSKLTVTNVLNKNCQSHKMKNIIHKVFDKNDLFDEFVKREKN